MNCEKIEVLFPSYLEDELSPEESAAVRNHLESCPECFSLLSSLKETMDSLAGFPELEPSESLIQRLQTIPKKKAVPVLNFFLRPSLQPVFAVATILLVLFSFYAFHPNRKQINLAVNRQVHLGFSKLEKLFAKAESFTDHLGAQTDNILVSLKNFNPLGGDEE